MYRKRYANLREFLEKTCVFSFIFICKISPCRPEPLQSLDFSQYYFFEKNPAAGSIPVPYPVLQHSFSIDFLSVLLLFRPPVSPVRGSIRECGSFMLHARSRSGPWPMRCIPLFTTCSGILHTKCSRWYLLSSIFCVIKVTFEACV